MEGDEIYRNSPLQWAVFEVRFPGEPAVECQRDEFYKIVRGDFPEIFVPKLREGDAAALSPYHFQSADGTTALMTALNLFAFRTTHYRGFAAFRDEALRWLTEFARLFAIDNLTRTGLRYTNVIPYAPGQGFPIRRFLKIEMSFGGQPIERFDQFFMTSGIPTGDGALTMQVGGAKGEHGEDAIVLEFDFVKQQGLSFANVADYLNESHGETKKLFESLLTDEYRSYMRGEELR